MIDGANTYTPTLTCFDLGTKSCGAHGCKPMGMGTSSKPAFVALGPGDDDDIGQGGGDDELIVGTGF